MPRSRAFPLSTMCFSGVLPLPLPLLPTFPCVFFPHTHTVAGGSPAISRCKLASEHGGDGCRSTAEYAVQAAGGVTLHRVHASTAGVSRGCGCSLQCEPHGAVYGAIDDAIDSQPWQKNAPAQQSRYFPDRAAKLRARDSTRPLHALATHLCSRVYACVVHPCRWRY